jgi:hypothetical protein
MENWVRGEKMQRNKSPKHYAIPDPDAPGNTKFRYYLTWVNRREW